MIKRKGLFYKIVNISTNILIFPIVVIAIFVSISFIQTKKQNMVPSLFNYSAVRIVSGSMENSGFKIGNIVLIKKVKVSDLKEGDIIAFYYRYTPNSNRPMPGDNVSPEIISEFSQSWNGEDGGSTLTTGSEQSYIYDAAKSGTRIYFHKIVEIRIEKESGRFWYKTWGTNNIDNEGNPVYDTYWINQGFVIGKYAKSYGILSSIITFSGSYSGIICFITLPCGVILIMLIIQLLDEIDKQIRAKKLKLVLKKPLLKNKERIFEFKDNFIIKNNANFKYTLQHVFYINIANTKKLAMRIVRNQNIKIEFMKAKQDKSEGEKVTRSIVVSNKVRKKKKSTQKDSIKTKTKTNKKS